MRNIIIDFHESDTWKIQLIIAINISSKDGEEEHVMHSKSNNTKLTIYWTKKRKKKATINPKKKDDKYFQYAVKVALNYEEIKLNPERVSNITPFIKKYKWKIINYPLKIDWKTFEKYNLTIALNILYIKEKEIYPAYISKIKTKCEKQFS